MFRPDIAPVLRLSTLFCSHIAFIGRMKTKTEKDKQMMKVILSQEAVLCQMKFILSAVNRLILFEMRRKSYIDIECCQCHNFKSGSCFKSHIDSHYSEYASITKIAGMGFRQMLVFIFENFVFFYERPTARLSQLLRCKGVFNHSNKLSNFFKN